MIDHIGFAVHSLEGAAGTFAALTGFTPQGGPVDDPIHQCRILFLGRDGLPRIELVQPLGKDGPLAKAAQQGGGIHHFCLQVASLDGFEDWCRATGFKKVMGPNPAPAMGNRRVGFVHAPAIGLMEFVETEGAAPLDKLDVNAKPLLGAFLGWMK